MSLSAREILLVLRARDEASRTLGRVSSSMRKLDRDALTASNAMIKGSNENLLQLRRGVHDVEYGYQQATIRAREMYQAGTINAEQYRRMMLDSRKARVEQMRAIRLDMNATEDSIRQHRDRIVQIQEENERIRHQGQLIQNVGYGLIGAGVGMTYVGTQGVRAWVDVTRATIDYEQAARRTLTQVDANRIGLDKIEAAGERIADTVPVAFDEIQPAMYDVFSSIDVNMRQASKLTRQFAKDAVAGNTDMAVATRANLQLMNAYSVAVKDSSKVSDFMFQLVRKGVGSYQEFASTIGNAIPSAVRLNVSIDELGGTLAFMTRNGLSAARASTSAARAFDALANPKTADNLKKLGVNIRDAKGEFIPFPDIIDKMSKKMEGLNAAQKSAFLKDAFYGSGGTLQAMRFFNLVFAHMDQFHKRLGEMKDDSNAAGKAFNTMAESPQARLQQLENDWRLLRIELGEKLLPVTLKIVDAINDLIDWFRNLDPQTQKTIAYIAAFGSAALVMFGILTAGLGTIAVFAGSIRMLGLSAGTAGKKMGRAVGGISAFVGGMIEAHQATNDTDKAIGIFSAAVGGAMAGSVFGPWGTAIGGVVGALGGLTAAYSNNRSELDKMKNMQLDYLDTLNATNAAITKQTKQTAFENLQRNNILPVARMIGIPDRDTVNAALGNVKAMERIVDRVRALTVKTKSGFGKASPDKAFFNEQRAKDFIWLLKAMGSDLSEDQKKALDMIHATESWGHALKDLPKQIRPKVKVLGSDASVKDIRAVLKEGKVLDKQHAKILLSAIGSKLTVKDILGVKKSVEDLNKTKVDMKSTSEGVKRSMQISGQAAKAGADTISNNVRSGTAKAKPNFSPFMQAQNAQMATLKGMASTGGLSIGSALKAGVLAGMGGLTGELAAEAAGAVRSAIAAARAAAKAHSPSREMMRLGKDMSDGLTIGFRVNAEKDIPKHKHTVDKIVKAIQQQIMKDIRDGRLKMSTIIDEARKLLEKKYKKIEPKAEHSLLHHIRVATERDMKHLERINKRFDKVTKRLEKARDRLNNLRQRRKDYEAAVKGSIKDFASFSSFQKPTDVFGNEEDFTVSNITSQLQSRLSTIRQFGKNLKTLLKMGFSKAVYDEVVQMGPEAGAEFAAALIQATPTEVSNINSLVSQVNTQAKSISTAAGREMYQAGIRAAEGLVKGLERKQKDIEKIAEHLGRLIAQTIKRILKIHSPSQVAMGLGNHFGNGLALGLRKQHKNVAAASRALAAATYAGDFDYRDSYAGRPSQRLAYPSPVVGGSTGSATGASVPNVKVDVHTQEIDPRRHAAELGWEIARNVRL